MLKSRTQINREMSMNVSMYVCTRVKVFVCACACLHVCEYVLYDFFALFWGGMSLSSSAEQWELLDPARFDS